MGSFTALQDNIKKIYTAYAQGYLLAHQFEFNHIDFALNDKNGLKDLIGVIKGDADAKFNNSYRTVSGENGGYTCLATTYLSNTTRASTFVVCNKVGFLFNGNDEKNLSYILACPSDMISLYTEREGIVTIDGNVLNGNQSLSENEKQIFKKQFAGTDNNYSAINMKELKLGKERDTLVKGAIDEFRAELITVSGTNEVLVNAKIKAVCGIIFSDDKRSVDHMVDAEAAYKEHLAPVNAIALRAFMKEVHDMELPVMKYDPLELDPDKRLSPFVLSRGEFTELKNYLKKNAAEFSKNEDIEKTLQYAEKSLILQDTTAKISR